MARRAVLPLAAILGLPFLLTFGGLRAETDPIAAINLERQRAGVPALVPDARLTRVALDHINLCMRSGRMGHVSDIAGVPLLSLLAAAGYEPAEATDLGGTGRQPAGLHWVDPDRYGPGYRGPTHFSELRNPRYTHVGHATGGGQNVTIYARPRRETVIAVGGPVRLQSDRPVTVPLAPAVPERYRVEYVAVRPGADLAVRVRPADGRAGPLTYVLLDAGTMVRIDGEPAERSELFAWLPARKAVAVTVTRRAQTYGRVAVLDFRTVPAGPKS